MSDKDTKKEIKKEEVKEETPVEKTATEETKTEAKPAQTIEEVIAARKKEGAAKRGANAGKPGEKREFTKNRRRPSKRRERVQSEFDQKMLAIRRVTRVSSGGRRFSFSVAMAIGNKKGKVGVGIGKAGDTTLAIDKAVRNAKKNMIEVKRNENDSIVHDVEAKYNSARVIIIPAKGRGMIAGSAVRDLLELAGITDVNAKILSGSKNKLNIGKATIKALKSLKN
jgi:small subunit ribosomal protein S5